jgi:hypothetical protein
MVVSLLGSVYVFIITPLQHTFAQAFTKLFTKFSGFLLCDAAILFNVRGTKPFCQAFVPFPYNFFFAFGRFLGILYSTFLYGGA